MTCGLPLHRSVRRAQQLRSWLEARPPSLLVSGVSPHPGAWRRTAGTTSTLTMSGAAQVYAAAWNLNQSEPGIGSDFAVPSQTVNNIGLMDARRNALVVSDLVIVVGIIPFAVGSLQRSSPAAAGTGTSSRGSDATSRRRAVSVRRRRDARTAPKTSRLRLPFVAAAAVIFPSTHRSVLPHRGDYARCLWGCGRRPRPGSSR